jgi:DNA-directed RNA polymerase specialized sigma24 family protein
VPGDALGEATLARARAGDEEAFRELTEPHRRELQLHCYRILGSVQDAEDLVQETLLAAWRSLEGDGIAAITRFGDTALFGQFGLPRTLRS